MRLTPPVLLLTESFNRYCALEKGVDPGIQLPGWTASRR